MRTPALPLFAVLLAASCSYRPKTVAAPPQTGPLSTDSVAELTDDDFLKLASGAQFVLIGEAHDNRCDHQQQARIINILASQKRIGAVGMEMLNVEQQPAIDLTNEGKVMESTLQGVLDWQKNWSVPYTFYEPIFAAVYKQQLKLVALNAPSAVVKKVRNLGLEELTPEEKRGITDVLLMPPEAQEASLRAALAAHHHASKADPQKAIDQFIRVQSFWDTQMAFAAHKASQSMKANVVVIAGAGHVEHGWGIAHRLRHFAPGAKVFSVMPRRIGETIEPGTANAYFECPEARPESMPTAGR